MPRDGFAFGIDRPDVASEPDLSAIIDGTFDTAGAADEGDVSRRQHSLQTSPEIDTVGGHPLLPGGPALGVF